MTIGYQIRTVIGWLVLAASVAAFWFGVGRLLGVL